MESGGVFSLHPSYYHQILFAKLDLKIRYPPGYEREIWHYEKANADPIRRSTNQFSRDNIFSCIDVNQKVHLFNQTIQNILINFLLNETVVCND